MAEKSSKKRVIPSKMTAKGQGMSLNVIIIAALALIVLVVLVAIFTGQIGGFKTGVSQGGNVELTQMKISYGDCHPSAARESEFLGRISRAQTSDDKDGEKAVFREEIARCDELSTDKAICGSSGCQWQ